MKTMEKLKEKQLKFLFLNVNINCFWKSSATSKIEGHFYWKGANCGTHPETGMPRLVAGN